MQEDSLVPLQLPLVAGPEGSFAAKLISCGQTLERRSIQTVQINIGKLCNLACKHCHVDAGPKKTRENMSRETVDRLLELLGGSSTLTTLDITGGAPELNPHFRYLVTAARSLGLRVIDRCNLTVLCLPEQTETAQFLADQRVDIVASLPCYLSDNVDRQRGRGVFDDSIAGLQQLDKLGYGHPGSGLRLDLVFNPQGINLPPPQSELEAAYKEHLLEHFGVQFNSLLAIVNMPINRFARDLQRGGKLDEYMELLRKNFNPQAAAGVMCREMISIGWDGQIFDCDFNQMLELPPAGGNKTIFELAGFDELSNAPVTIADHCYGCTAGSGSSCGGEITEAKK